MSDLLQTILNRYPNAQPDRRGEYHVDCPFCGKEAQRGQTHFSFSDSGYKCFVCGESGGLYAMSQRLGMTDAPLQPRIERKQDPQPMAPWRSNPDRLLAGYWNHPNRYTAWQNYKPISRETIDRHQFGYGRLPFLDKDGNWYMSRDQWLIVPLFEHDQLVGLRGRNLTDKGPKWISATGTSYTLWGVAEVQPGDTVWLCENYVDAAWLMQTHPEWKAVAIGGATTWRDGWCDFLWMRKPSRVIVALDCDLVGQATGATLSRLRRQWTAEHPGLKVPEPNGPKIANSLLKTGVTAILFKWPADAPDKAGIDWVLNREAAA